MRYLHLLSWFWIVFLLLSLFFATEVPAGEGEYKVPQIVPPRIDGSLADWPPELPEAQVEALVSLNPPENAADLTARFKAGYSTGTDMLYIAIMVTDDKAYAVFPLTDGGSWKNDRVEIYIDGDHSKNDTDYTFETAQQYDVYGPAEQAAKFEGGEKILLNYPAGANQEYPKDRDDYLTGVKRTGTETIYEVALVVYKKFDKSVTQLKAGVTIGFDMAIVDNDDGNDANASFLCWTDGGSKYKDETQFGNMAFTSEFMGVQPAGKLTTTWGAIKKSN